MGATYVSTHFKGTLSEKALLVEYDRYIEQQLHEYGHDGYNGTLSTCSGLAISHKEFDTYREADEFIFANTHKWGNALAVKCRNITKKTPKFTFNGQPSNGMAFEVQCVSDVYQSATNTVQYIAADQLTATEGAKAVALFTAMKTADRDRRKADHALSDYIAKLSVQLDAPLPKTLKTDLNTLRRAVLKTGRADEKASAAFTAFDAKMVQKYCSKVLEVIKEPLWVVGGWAAE